MSKCPSRLQHRDSNTRRYVHESSPITTRPGLPPTNYLYGKIDSVSTGPKDVKINLTFVLSSRLQKVIILVSQNSTRIETQKCKIKLKLFEHFQFVLKRSTCDRRVMLMCLHLPMKLPSVGHSYQQCSTQVGDIMIMQLSVVEHESNYAIILLIIQAHSKIKHDKQVIQQLMGSLKFKIIFFNFERKTIVCNAIIDII